MTQNGFKNGSRVPADATRDIGPTRTTAYFRSSSHRPDTHPFDRRIAEALAEINRPAADLVSVRSGAAHEREEFRELLDRARRGQIDAIFVEDAGRLGCSDFDGLLRTLKEVGVTIHGRSE